MENFKVAQTAEKSESFDSKEYNSSGEGESCQDNGSIMFNDDDVSDNGSTKQTTSKSGSKDQDPSVRAKNREHAKNTRIRKKNYIETLKDNIKVISDNRDVRDQDRKAELSRLADHTNARKQAINAFFSFRATVDTSIQLWSSILSDDFTCAMPLTPFRSYPPHEVHDGQRWLKGAAAMVYDTVSFHVTLQSMAKFRPSPGFELPKITLVYDSTQSASVMHEDTFMCRWTMRTEGLVAQGLPFELTQQGMLRAEFVPGCTLLKYVGLAMDVMSFMQQLRRVTGRDSFQVIPNVAFPLDLQSQYHSHPTEFSAAFAASPPRSVAGGSVVTHSTSTSAESYSHNHQSHNNNNNNSNNNSGSFYMNSTNQSNAKSFRDESMEAFLGSSQARAVVNAANPFVLLFTNQQFQSLFLTHSLVFANNAFPLFSSLIRLSENSPQQVEQISHALQSGLPCGGVLFCFPASKSGVASAPLRCMCSFFPLFADGVVQQYLVAFDVIETHTVLNGDVTNSTYGTHAHHVHDKHTHGSSAVTNDASGRSAQSLSGSVRSSTNSRKVRGSHSSDSSNSGDTDCMSHSSSIQTPHSGAQGAGSHGHVDVAASRFKGRNGKSGSARSRVADSSGHKRAASSSPKTSDDAYGAHGVTSVNVLNIGDTGARLPVLPVSRSGSSNGSQSGSQCGSSSSSSSSSNRAKASYALSLTNSATDGTTNTNSGSGSGGDSGGSGGSGTNSGNGSDSGMNDSPLHLEDFAYNDDTPLDDKLLFTTEPGSSQPHMLPASHSLNITSENPFQVGQSSANLTDLDIDEKFFDQFE